MDTEDISIHASCPISPLLKSHAYTFLLFVIFKLICFFKAMLPVGSGITLFLRQMRVCVGGEIVSSTHGSLSMVQWQRIGKSN